MNPFQRARDLAHVTREKLAPGKAETPISAKELLGAVETKLKLGVEPVEPTYADLGEGSAVLQRAQRFIYVSKKLDEWGDEFCGLVAHELGHWFLDATKPATTVASLATLFGSDGSPGVLKVEAYGARERQELQANVFARELLLPRSVARSLAASGKGAYEVAKSLGVPIEFVRQQMLDALLLPEAPSVSTSLSAPSPDQFAAARAEERAANVVAGPGTGKTTTLIHRVKHLIEEKGVNPNEILVLTFTNKAAFELVERLRCAGIDQAAEVWAGTFHAYGLEFLRKYHQRFGLDADLRVADVLTSMTMLVGGLPRVTLEYYLRVEDPYEWLGPVIKGITRLKEELVTPAEYRQFVLRNPERDEELQRRRIDVATLFELHETLLAERKAVDFVDLISKPAMALRTDRGPFAELADRFQHVLVDEYQDVTQAMVELLRQLAYRKSIWVVGDVRQAIHHWRGASLKSLLKFDSEFKAHANGSKIKRYPLESNRRSYQEIVDLTQHVGRSHVLEPRMRLDPVTATKGPCGERPTVVTCEKRDEVLGAVINGIRMLEGKGVPYGQQAVLCRKTNNVQAVAEALAAHGLPVVYIGELAQRAEVKQLLCLMQLLVERRPKALFGLAHLPGLSMPMQDIQLLLRAAETDVCYQRGRWLDTPPPGLSPQGRAVLAKLSQLLRGYRHNSNPWTFVCDLLLEHKVALPNPSDSSVHAWVQRISLWQFAYGVRNGNGEMKEARLSRFLMRHRLRKRIGDGQVQRELPPEAAALDGVRLMTVHGSKGLEFEAVHVAYVNADDYGPQPPSWQPENIMDIVPPEALGSSGAEYDDECAVERNNLLYVAVSRARRHLYLYQEGEYGPQTLAPQLQHFPRKYQEVSYAGPVVKVAKTITKGAFVGPSRLSFEDFDIYTACSLKYWYSRVQDLQSEADVDVSVRARWAVMDALKSYASGASPSTNAPLVAAAATRKLPSKSDDPELWMDIEYALSRGVAQIHSLRSQGGKFCEPTSVVGGVTIDMPWGFALQGPYFVEFAMLRFARRRVSDLSIVLKPMVPGLALSGSKKLTLSYVLSDKSDDVQGAKRIESTKSFKAAVRLLAGERTPVPGGHCAWCDFSTICPSAPI